VNHFARWCFRRQEPDLKCAPLAPQDEGKIRAVGVSNFGPADLAAALATGVRISSNQLPYSLCWRAIEAGVVGACSAGGVGILAYSPLGQGLLSGKYSTTADCGAAIARSRLFHHSASAKARHDEEGCEDELWAAVAALRGASEEVRRALGPPAAPSASLPGPPGPGRHPLAAHALAAVPSRARCRLPEAATTSA